MEKEEKKYYDYLVRLIRKKESNNYLLILRYLWKKEYYGILPNDQNREKDGIYLRQEFGAEMNFGPCRILEMLIALSRRMEFQLYGTDYNKSYKDLFWELFDNLGLTKFDNLETVKDSTYLEIDHILVNWLERRYSPNGFGSIFPIKKWRKGIDEPQTNVETWYQMMLYLGENYKI